jgi:hypothetical protein
MTAAVLDSWAVLHVLGTLSGPGARRRSAVIAWATAPRRAAGGARP